jgi:hypothetical protein
MKMMRLGRRRKSARERAEVVTQVRKLCEEDITLLGEQLGRLDAATGAQALDEVARDDYQNALDAYESAQRAIPKVLNVDQVVAVTDLLNEGRYALACVQAQVAGQPPPPRRAPCFFNPQHGPSVKDVVFTPRAGGTRRVAACAQDAARVEAGEKPEIRTIEVGDHAVPYRDAVSASAVLDANYHEAAMKSGHYGGFPIFPGGS